MIYLSSPVLTVKNIPNPSNADVIRDTEIGDKVQWCMPLKSPGRGSRGNTYASHITFANLTKKLKRTYTLNTMKTALASFEFEEVHDAVELYMRRNP